MTILAIRTPSLPAVFSTFFECNLTVCDCSQSTTQKPFLCCVEAVFLGANALFVFAAFWRAVILLLFLAVLIEISEVQVSRRFCCFCCSVIDCSLASACPWCLASFLPISWLLCRKSKTGRTICFIRSFYSNSHCQYTDAQFFSWSHRWRLWRNARSANPPFGEEGASSCAVCEILKLDFLG